MMGVMERRLIYLRARYKNGVSGALTSIVRYDRRYEVDRRLAIRRLALQSLVSWKPQNGKKLKKQEKIGFE
jgi:hypothetical protein